MKDLGRLRQIFISLVEDIFDVLAEEDTSADESSSFELLDDDDDTYDYDEFEDYESQDDFWPNLGDVTAQGSGAETTQQPSIEWPNVSEPAPKVSWPNVGSVVGICPQNKVVAPAPDITPVGVAQSTHWTPSGPVVTNHGPTGPLVTTPAATEESVSTDGRGRACVPKHLVTKLGFKPGDMVYVSVRAHKQPGLVLLPKPSQTGHLSTYVVDKDGNIRLSHYVLTQGNLGLYTTVKFKAYNDRIVVLAG